VFRWHLLQRLPWTSSFFLLSLVFLNCYELWRMCRSLWVWVVQKCRILSRSCNFDLLTFSQLPNLRRQNFCDTCLQDDNCVWCSKTSSCELAETATCLMAHTCESYCNGVMLCDACGQLPGCVWCDDSKLCADASTATCFFTHSCDFTPPSGPDCGFNGGAFVGGMFLVIVLVALLGAGFAFYKWRAGARISYTELK